MIRRRRLSPVWNSIQINTNPRSKIQNPRNLFGVVNYDQRKTWSPLSSTADALSPGQLFQSPQILILQHQNQNRVNLGNKCIFFGIEYLILQKFIWRKIAFTFRPSSTGWRGLIYSDLVHFQIFGQNQFPLMKWPALLDMDKKNCLKIPTKSLF